MIMRKLRLLTLSKVDPLPVLNYAHNCTTPLLSLISMIIMTMMIMTMTMTMMMKNCESVRPVLKRQHSKYPQKTVLVLAAWVAEFILVTVNITPTLAPPLNVALRQNSRFLRRNFLHFLRRTQREGESEPYLCAGKELILLSSWRNFLCLGFGNYFTFVSSWGSSPNWKGQVRLIWLLCIFSIWSSWTDLLPLNFENSLVTQIFFCVWYESSCADKSANCAPLRDVLST